MTPSATRPPTASLCFDKLVQQIGMMPLGELMAEVLRLATLSIDAARVSCWQICAEGTSLRCAESYLRDADAFETPDLELGEKSAAAWFAALRGQPGVLAATNLLDEPLWLGLRDGGFLRDDTRAVIAAPMRRGERLFGVLVFEWPGGVGGWHADVIAFAGQSAQWLALAVDMDSRRQAEHALRESEANYRMVIEHSPAATLIVDVDTGRFVDANASAAKLYGKARETLLAGGVAEVSPAYQPDGRSSAVAAREVLARALAGDTPRFDWMHLHTDGRQIPCSVHLARMPGHAGHQAIATVIDRTDQIEAEKTIRRALDNEREINELRSRFTAIVSHEFRTPLGIIMSAAELLEMYFDRLDTGKRGELLDDIRQSTRRMAALMEQVLVLGKAEAGKLPFSPAPIDLVQLCERLVDETRSATAGRCPFRLQCGGRLDGATADESLLRHVLTNLLTNAAKYSPAGSVVDFTVQRDGRQVVFEVIDRGIGIPEADQPRMFEAFQRAGNVGETAGTGLGLLIAKRCVEQHAGSIRFESRAGEGTRFRVELPVFA